MKRIMLLLAFVAGPVSAQPFPCELFNYRPLIEWCVSVETERQERQMRGVLEVELAARRQGSDAKSAQCIYANGFALTVPVALPCPRSVLF